MRSLIVNMQNKPQLLQTYHAPAQTAWLVITIINNQQQLAFLDAQLELISKVVAEKTYNPHIRPWYVNAIKTNAVVRTEPYLFSNLNKWGFTFATRINHEQGVLAVDYTVQQFNEILALQKVDKNSEVFIVNTKGAKLASSAFVKSDFSDVSKAENSDISFNYADMFKAKNSSVLENISQQFWQLFDSNTVSNDLAINIKSLDPELLSAILEKKIATIIEYTEAGKHYQAILLPLRSRNTYLGVKIDADLLSKPYKDNIQHSFLIAFFLLLLLLPAIFFSTNRPINALILENEKIKNRKFNKVKHIKTRIVEFDDLSESLLSMSQSIQVYELKQEELLNSIIKLIAEAIDAKSAYTGGHYARVPTIAQLLLDEANKCDEGVFKDFQFNSKEELREFEIGAWLHDCGKVTTPEYVIDKPAKLETIYNRIHEVRMRFEVLWRDAEINYVKQSISEQELKNQQNSLREDFEFLASSNIGGEFMGADKQLRVQEIADKEWLRHFDDRLGLGEVEALRYGRQKSTKLPVVEKLLCNKIEHIVKRENFDPSDYEQAGFKLEVPEHLHNIPEYAGTHHETLIGTGYPRKLTKDELSIPARIMAIADIFEALTASDRPYKKAKTLSASIKIMSFMVKDQHIDADLFKLFLTSGVYKDYAQKFLEPEQIDEVDITSYLL